MTKGEYLERAFNAFNSGKVSEEVYDFMVENVDDFVDEEEHDERLPKCYAEIDYSDRDFDTDLEARQGAIFDNMNYRHYMER